MFHIAKGRKVGKAAHARHVRRNRTAIRIMEEGHQLPDGKKCGCCQGTQNACIVLPKGASVARCLRCHIGSKPCDRNDYEEDDADIGADPFITTSYPYLPNISSGSSTIDPSLVAQFRLMSVNINWDAPEYAMPPTAEDTPSPFLAGPSQRYPTLGQRTGNCSSGYEADAESSVAYPSGRHSFHFRDPAQAAAHQASLGVIPSPFHASVTASPSELVPVQSFDVVDAVTQATEVGSITAAAGYSDEGEGVVDSVAFQDWLVEVEENPDAVMAADPGAEEDFEASIQHFQELFPGHLDLDFETDFDFGL